MSEDELLAHRATISGALDLGIQSWRTVPSARDRFMEAVSSLGKLATEIERLQAIVQEHDLDA